MDKKKLEYISYGFFIGAFTMIALLIVPFMKYKKIETKINFIADTFQENYYKEITDEDKEEIKQNIYSGLLSDYDIYSRYYTEKEYKEEMEKQTHQYYGIGVQTKYSEEKHNYIVIDVLDNSPAYKGGLLKGYLIEAIDGVSTSVVGITDFTDRLKGAENSVVTLDVLRDDEHLSLKIQREAIEYPTVKYQMIDTVGYIKLSSFATNSAEEFKEALTFMDNNNAQDIIVDLRNNIGGSVFVLEDICSLLFPSDILFYDVMKDGSKIEMSFKSDLSDCKYNIYVLVNHTSASCSEIFASYIQAKKFGVLIGEQTFGKGCTQDFMTFSDNTAFQYTKSYWETIDGKNIMNNGIYADYYCKDDKIDMFNYDIDRTNDLLLDYALDVISDRDL